MIPKTIAACVLALWAVGAGAEDWLRVPMNGGYVEADMDSVRLSPQATRTVNFRFRWDPARALNDGRPYDAMDSVWELDCEGRRFRVAFSRTLHQGTELAGQQRSSAWHAIAPKNSLFDKACERPTP